MSEAIQDAMKRLREGYAISPIVGKRIANVIEAELERILALHVALMKNADKRYDELMATVAEYRKDTARLNQLEKLMWTPENHGLVLFPLIEFDTDAKIVELNTLDEEDVGDNFAGAICEAPTLREAIDLSMDESE